MSNIPASIISTLNYIKFWPLVVATVLFCKPTVHVLLQVPSALDLNGTDTATLLGKTTQNALPVIEEVSVAPVLCTPDRTIYIYIYSMIIRLFFYIFKIPDFYILVSQMARLQSSMVFKAASSLDFQKNMFGSINMLLCGEQPDISLRSRRQMDNNTSFFIMGNSSGKCCSKLLCKAIVSHSVSPSCVYILALQCM